MLILAASTFWLQDQYLLLGFVLIIISVIPFLLKFESKRMEAREVVLISILAAIAAVSRVPFAALPSVQPTSFVIILTGLVFGPETGFMVGAVAALVSNIFLGQGPWTPWQIFAWGLMGLTAGLLPARSWFKSKIGILTFGFIWGFVFGWIMDTWFVVGFINPLTWKSVLGSYISSFYFDLLHALSNVFFIRLFLSSWMKVLQRIKLKYGLH